MDTGIHLYTPYTSSLRYACFGCRICFHKSKYAGATHKCPTCQKVMLYTGNAFRAPPKRAVKEWAKLEVLVRAGMRFHYCGGNGQIKGLTVADAKQYRKQTSTLKNDNIGQVNYAVRQPGNGKRKETKAWYGIESYRVV